MKKKLAIIEKKINALCRERQKIEAKLECEQTIPKARAKCEGKCYKYHNSYSCPKTDEDYWWLYMKIIKIKDDGIGVCETFQEDKYGILEFKSNEDRFHIGDTLLPSWKEISQQEYEGERAAFFSKIEFIRQSRRNP